MSNTSTKNTVDLNTVTAAQIDKAVADMLNNRLLAGRKAITALKRQITIFNKNGLQGVDAVVAHTNDLIAAYNNLNDLIRDCGGVYGSEVLEASRVVNRLAKIKFKTSKPIPRAHTPASLSNDYENAMDILFGKK